MSYDLRLLRRGAALPCLQVAAGVLSATELGNMAAEMLGMLCDVYCMLEGRGAYVLRGASRGLE